jgi:hypothetical protein
MFVEVEDMALRGRHKSHMQAYVKLSNVSHFAFSIKRSHKTFYAEREGILFLDIIKHLMLDSIGRLKLGVLDSFQNNVRRK